MFVYKIIAIVKDPNINENARHWYLARSLYPKIWYYILPIVSIEILTGIIYSQLSLLKYSLVLYTPNCLY